ncbi:MAG: saccharopine dehydrogenase family protein [Candidatus Bathyarchaeia archaeon]|nr:saccharopine dehydrogenase family protein [Candidatus Bathyarchaeota archaeon]
MRIILIGCGHIGSVLAADLAENMPSSEIVVSDSDVKRVEEVISKIRRGNLSIAQLDAADYQNLVNVLKRFDIAVGLTPGRLGYQAVRACIETGVDMVDLSYMPEDVMLLNQKALEAGVTVIPDCGLAPGLSNMFVGRAASLLDQVEEAIILVGGIPEKPIPPLGYKVTWCVDDLIEEYTRRVKIVRDGRLVEVEALDGLELIEFPEVGVLEAFYTDGVRTLHHTIKGVRNMWEKTLRYPGHAEKIKLLRDLGFFDEPYRQTTMRLLEERLSLPELRDLVVMSVKVIGLRGGSRVAYIYHLLDRYDDVGKVTAMARTTAYTASIVIQLLARGEIREKGIIPPENLGMSEEIFNKIISWLRNKGIKIWGEEQAHR